jgi:hypothetical protein
MLIASLAVSLYLSFPLGLLLLAFAKKGGP